MRCKNGPEFTVQCNIAHFEKAMRSKQFRGRRLRHSERTIVCRAMEIGLQAAEDQRSLSNAPKATAKAIYGNGCGQY